MFISHLDVLSYEVIAGKEQEDTYTTRSRFFSDEIAGPRYRLIISTVVVVVDI
jgi:hypothetical protein